MTQTLNNVQTEFLTNVAIYSGSTVQNSLIKIAYDRNSSVN